MDYFTIKYVNSNKILPQGVDEINQNMNYFIGNQSFTNIPIWNDIGTGFGFISVLKFRPFSSSLSDLINSCPVASIKQESFDYFIILELGVGVTFLPIIGISAQYIYLNKRRVKRKEETLTFKENIIQSKNWLKKKIKRN